MGWFEVKLSRHGVARQREIFKRKWGILRKYTLLPSSLFKSVKAVICLKSSSNYGFLFWQTHGTFGRKLWFLVEPRGVEPLSCDDIMSTYYTLVPFLLFRVLVFRQRTDNTQTASSIKSRTQTDESDLCARTLLAPRYHSVRLIWDVALSGECVLFVRSYWFDRWLTRQTIILGMQSARSTSSRIRNGPMQIGNRM